MISGLSQLLNMTTLWETHQSARVLLDRVCFQMEATSCTPLQPATYGTTPCLLLLLLKSVAGRNCGGSNEWDWAYPTYLSTETPGTRHPHSSLEVPEQRPKVSFSAR